MDIRLIYLQHTMIRIDVLKRLFQVRTDFFWAFLCCYVFVNW